MAEQSVVKIAIDPHKRINAVVVVDATGSVLARGTFAQSTTGFAELMAVARRWRRREWAVEGATAVGKNLAQRLVARGEKVFDVPSKKSSLVRAFLCDQRPQERRRGRLLGGARRVAQRLAAGPGR